MAILLLICSTAWGWGSVGHRTIAVIAESRLTPAAAEELKNLFGPAMRLRDLAVCADEVRSRERDAGFQMTSACRSVFPKPFAFQTGDWHFINIPASSAASIPEEKQVDQFCKQQNDCVTRQVDKFVAVLKNPQSDRTARRQAVAFLVHFIGDLHQPLHAADRNGDRGGTDTKVTFFGAERNLHRVWDSEIIERVTSDDGVLATKIQDEIKTAAATPKKAVRAWTIESHIAARDIAYHGVASGAMSKLDQDYQNRADPAVRRQLARAGVRLANVLNECLKRVHIVQKADEGLDTGVE